MEVRNCQETWAEFTRTTRRNSTPKSPGRVGSGRRPALGLCQWSAARAACRRRADTAVQTDAAGSELCMDAAHHGYPYLRLVRPSQVVYRGQRGDDRYAETDTEPGTRLLPGSPGTGHAMARPAFMFGCRPYLTGGLRRPSRGASLSTTFRMTRGTGWRRGAARLPSCGKSNSRSARKWRPRG